MYKYVKYVIVYYLYATVELLSEDYPRINPAKSGLRIGVVLGEGLIYVKI